MGLPERIRTYSTDLATLDPRYLGLYVGGRRDGRSIQQHPMKRTPCGKHRWPPRHFRTASLGPEEISIDSVNARSAASEAGCFFVAEADGRLLGHAVLEPMG